MRCSDPRPLTSSDTPFVAEVQDRGIHLRCSFPSAHSMTKPISTCLLSSGVLMASLLAATPDLRAQPDAGQLLNQQQRNEPLPGRKADGRNNQADGLPPDSATAFRARIRTVRFSGAEGTLPAAELQRAVGDVLGQELTHNQLQALAARITALLQQRGFPLARAYLPRQDLTEGTLEIAVLQGRLETGPRRLQIDNNSGVATPSLQAIADAALPEGALRTEQLERALLLMNDLEGVTARARLERGGEPGTSRLVINGEANPPLRTQISLDNFLNRYTGTIRGNLRMAWANPGGVGDSLGLGLNLSEGNQGLNASYSRPLTPSGLRLGVGVSTLDYQIGQELAPLELKGRAQSVNATLSYPIQRSRAANIWVAAEAEGRQLRDDSLAGNLRDRRLQRLQLSAFGNDWQSFGMSGSTNWQLTAVAGQVNLDGNATDAALDQDTASTQGAYAKLGLQLGRVQNLDAQGAWTLFGGVSAQVAGNNLDSSEKFILGGPSGVRAHAVGEASGDNGWLATLEVRRDFRAAEGVQAQALVFADAGGVQLHQRPWASALPAGRDNHVGLSGVGIGLNLYAQGWQLRSALALSTGGNEARQPDGRDADGRTSRTRAWLQASTSF